MTAIIRPTIRRLLEDESGATAIEYALLAGLIATVLIVSVASIGLTVGGVFTSADAQLRAAPGAPASTP